MRLHSTLVCFIAAHIGLILAIIALSTTHWIEGNKVNNTKVTNDTCAKGLWDSSCGMVDTVVMKDGMKKEMTYFTITQYFYSFSAGLCLLGVIRMYIMLIVKRCGDSRICFGFLTLVFGVSSLLGLVAMCLVPTGANKENTFPEGYKTLFMGWSYWVAVSSVIFIFVSMLTSACTTCTSDEKKQYEKI